MLNAQGFPNDTVAYLAEMQQQHNKLTALKNGAKELTSKKAEHEKEATEQESLLKNISSEVTELQQEVNKKSIELQTRENEIGALETEINELETKANALVAANEALNEVSLGLAEKILDINKLYNQQTNEILERSSEMEALLKSQALMEMGLKKINISIDSITEKVSGITLDLINNTRLSDSVLVLKKGEIEILKGNKKVLASKADSTKTLLLAAQRNTALISATTTKLKAELQQLVDKREQLNGDIKNNNAQISNNKTEVEQLNTKITEKKSAVGGLKEQKSLLQFQLDAFQARKITGEKQKSEIETKLSSLRNSILKCQSDIDVANSPALEACLSGIAKAKDREVTAAILLFDQAIAGDHDNSLAYYLRSYSYLVQGKLPEATADISKAIALQPNHTETYLVQANLHVKDKDFLAAVKDHEQVITIDPVAKESYYQKGFINYLYLNESETACKDWEKASGMGHEKATAALANYCAGSKPRTSFNMAQIVKEAPDTTYAYNPLNPVKVGRNTEAEDYHANETSYLQLLRGLAGEPVKFQRIGTCCQYKSPNGVNGIAMLDKFLVTYATKRGTVIKHTVYFSSYDYSQPRLPKGFKTTHRVE